MDLLSIGSSTNGPAKVAYTARRLVEAGYGTTRHVGISAQDRRPEHGDLVLCEIARIGQHKALLQRHGVRNQLFAGERVVVAYGSRYAPDQFEAELPVDLGPCELVAGGGVAARVISQHARMIPATTLRPVGLLLDESGRVINTKALALDRVELPHEAPLTVAVVGTSMNAGKTTAAASLVRGLVRAGHRVGAAKVTGTGAPNDPLLMSAAGAARVLDFTDLGYPSTYQLPGALIESLLHDTIAQLAADKVDVAVLEIADGILQPETEALLGSAAFRHSVDRVVFAAADSVSALAGTRELLGRGLAVAAVTGVLTQSPLATAEAARSLGDVVIPTMDLTLPEVAIRVIGREHAFGEAARALSLTGAAGSSA